MHKRQTLSLALLLATCIPAGAALADTQATTGNAAGANLKITTQDDRATRTDLSNYFTGDALVNPLFSAEDDSNATAAEVTFDRGARTNWHTHPVGQQLVVTHGVGRVQIEGRPMRTIHAGDVVWIPADANHWHGAAPDHSMTHIAIQERREGKNVAWGDSVSDGEYNAE